MGTGSTRVEVGLGCGLPGASVTTGSRPVLLNSSTPSTRALIILLLAAVVNTEAVTAHGIDRSQLYQKVRLSPNLSNLMDVFNALVSVNKAI